MKKRRSSGGSSFFHAAQWHQSNHVMCNFIFLFTCRGIDHRLTARKVKRTEGYEVQINTQSNTIYLWSRTRTSPQGESKLFCCLLSLFERPVNTPTGVFSWADHTLLFRLKSDDGGYMRSVGKVKWQSRATFKNKLFLATLGATESVVRLSVVWDDIVNIFRIVTMIIYMKVLF